MKQPGRRVLADTNERDSMSIRSKVLATAAALTLLGGLGTASAITAGTARAATPSCGSACIDIFSKNFGTFGNPQFVLDVYRQKQSVGQKIILFRESNSDPAEGCRGRSHRSYPTAVIRAVSIKNHGLGRRLQLASQSMAWMLLP